MGPRNLDGSVARQMTIMVGGGLLDHARVGGGHRFSTHPPGGRRGAVSGKTRNPDIAWL